jgi:carbonic anhydrase
MANGRPSDKLKIPLKEFINYLPDTYVYYRGSDTVPDCEASVTWMINTSPHVITQEQVDHLNAALSTKVYNAGGNYRNI